MHRDPVYTNLNKIYHRLRPPRKDRGALLGTLAIVGVIAIAFIVAYTRDHIEEQTTPRAVYEVAPARDVRLWAGAGVPDDIIEATYARYHDLDAEAKQDAVSERLNAYIEAHRARSAVRWIQTGDRFPSPSEKDSRYRFAGYTDDGIVIHRMTDDTVERTSYYVIELGAVITANDIPFDVVITDIDRPGNRIQVQTVDDTEPVSLERVD